MPKPEALFKVSSDALASTQRSLEGLRQQVVCHVAQHRGLDVNEKNAGEIVARAAEYGSAVCEGVIQAVPMARRGDFTKAAADGIASDPFMFGMPDIIDYSKLPGNIKAAMAVAVIDRKLREDAKSV